MIAAQRLIAMWQNVRFDAHRLIVRMISRGSGGRSRPCERRPSQP